MGLPGILKALSPLAIANDNKRVVASAAKSAVTNQSTTRNVAGSPGYGGFVAMPSPAAIAPIARAGASTAPAKAVGNAVRAASGAVGRTVGSNNTTTSQTRRTTGNTGGLATAGSGTAGVSSFSGAAGGSAGPDLGAIRDRLMGQKGIIFDSANMAAGAGGRRLNSSILDFVQGLRTGQQGIDNKAINNELARKQAQSDILSMINRGVSSGASVLRNANAGSSSAAQALAQAYGDIGRRELSGVGQQYELGNREVQQSQQALDAQRASGVRSIQDSKQDIVDNIVADATNGLAALDAQLIDASLPDRIAIEQEKAAIRNNVMSQLSQFDEMLSREAGGVRALDEGGRRAEAARLATAGTAAEDAFDYETETPTDLQGTGPFAGDLPLFTYRRRLGER